MVQSGENDDKLLTMRGFLAFTTITALLCSCNPVLENIPVSDTIPSIEPDYTSVTVPRNIAPLDFSINAEADSYMTRIGGRITVKGRKVIIPEKKWKSLLEDRDTIGIRIYLRSEGRWSSAGSFKIYVAQEDCDPYICYRLIEPAYDMAGEMCIAQRDIRSFKEREVLNNTLARDLRGGQCINCHSFQNYGTSNMQFHVRQKNGGTVIVRDGNARKVNLKRDGFLSAGVYPSWHPTEPLIAYSMNKTRQQFPSNGHQKTEVFDTASDLVLYDVDADSLQVISAGESAFETFPCWSPDGKRLYYCSAGADSSVAYENLRYNILARDFNPATMDFGPGQLVVDAASQGMSASLPRVSPDGRYLLYTMGARGTFHIWHEDADLHILDLVTGEQRKVENINSPDTESYHSWSSNGRWILFSSRRDDGNYTRLYLAYFDRDGKAHKPFILPQKDPEYYRRLFKSYNVPEFTKSEILFDLRSAVHDIPPGSVKNNRSMVLHWFRGK